MAFYIQKPEIITPTKTVYYTGGNTWSDDYSLKMNFNEKSVADATIVNPNGTNGGFAGVTVVSE